MKTQKKKKKILKIEYGMPYAAIKYKSKDFRLIDSYKINKLFLIKF